MLVVVSLRKRRNFNCCQWSCPRGMLIILFISDFIILKVDHQFKCNKLSVFHYYNITAHDVLFYFRSSYYTCKTCCLQSLENLILLSQRYWKLVLMHCHPVIVVVICLPTKHLGDLKNILQCVRAFQIEWEFGSDGFWGQGKIKPEHPEKNLSEQGRERRTGTILIIILASILGQDLKPGHLGGRLVLSQHCATLAT